MRSMVEGAAFNSPRPLSHATTLFPIRYSLLPNSFILPNPPVRLALHAAAISG